MASSATGKLARLLQSAPSKHESTEAQEEGTQLEAFALTYDAQSYQYDGDRDDDLVALFRALVNKRLLNEVGRCRLNTSA